jgi:hypothetical protein
MTAFVRILLLSLLPCLALGSTPPQKSIEGLWGGKWDDSWPVFIEVHAGSRPGEYKVVYRWLENLSDAKFSREDLVGKTIGNHIEAKFLIFSVDERGGILYGAFDNPRMANLVRITPDNTNVEDVVLESHGWVPGAIPADEALAKIKARDHPQPRTDVL